MAVSFDTPSSATSYSIRVTGTVAANSTAHVMVTLAVNNATATHSRADLFYREINYANTTFTALAAHGTYLLTITPQVYGADTVTPTISWSY